MAFRRAHKEHWKVAPLLFLPDATKKFDLLGQVYGTKDFPTLLCAFSTWCAPRFFFLCVKCLFLKTSLFFSKESVDPGHFPRVVENLEIDQGPGVDTWIISSCGKREKLKPEKSIYQIVRKVVKKKQGCEIDLGHISKVLGLISNIPKYAKFEKSAIFFVLVAIDLVLNQNSQSWSHLRKICLKDSFLRG